MGIAATTNVYKLAAMVRACNTSWACNVFRNIDPDFIIHYFVHGSESCNFTPQFYMWVPHAAGVFQTRTNEGKVGLTFNILWTGIKITSDETKRPVSLPYNVFYMKAPIQIGEQLDSQVRLMRYRVQRSSIHCILMNDWVSRSISPQDLTFVTIEGHLS